MERFYDVVGGSRQAVHAGRLRAASALETEASVIDMVQAWRAVHPRMGSRVMYKSMIKSGAEIPMGVTAFEQLLSRRGLTVGKMRRFVPRTSDGRGKRAYENLCNGLTLNNIGQLLVTDITYYWLVDRWCFLFVVKDVYSQRLLSLYPSGSMTAADALAALHMAVGDNAHIDWKDCLHHSDNGSQYEARIYLVALSKLGMKVSRAKSCEQNGSCEQMHHIIKNMYLQPMAPQDMVQMRAYCKKVVTLMNDERAVEQLGYMTVQEFEDTVAEMAPGSRPKKKLHDFGDHA